MGLGNALKLTTLFAVLVALFGAIGYWYMGTTGLIMGLLFAGAMNFASYFWSDKIVLKMYNAEELDEQRYSDLHETVKRLADEAGIPKPKLYLVNRDNPNAFATGRNPENSAVAVTSGLLQHLSSEEVEGVLAHELGHVKNRDTLIQAVAGTFAGAISILAQMLWFSSLGGENKNPALLFGGMLLAPIAASLVKMAISRSREYNADSTAAQWTDPGYLASALRRIQAATSQRPMQQGPRGTSHMFIINPFEADTFGKLFSTHPPTEERVARLKAI